MGHETSPGATLSAVSVASFLMPFMLSGVGVALPSIGREFGASAVELGLVETAYMASASIFLLAMGRLGDLHGRRRVFQWGIALFTVVGAAMPFSGSMRVLIALRFLQGIGGAMVASTGPAIVVAVFPPEKRGRALGVLVAAIYAGLSCGPPVGGALISSLGWRSIYYLTVLLGVGAFGGLAWKLRGDWAEAKGEPFDWRGSAVYACALLVLTAGAVNLRAGDWAWGLLASGALGLWAFTVLEARTPYPILDVGLLRDNRVFALSNLAALLNYAATFGVTFFLSLYLQYAKGMTPHHAGLVLVVSPLTQTLLSPACGRLSDRVAADRVATAGMALCALGVGAAATLSASSPLWVIVATLLLLGLGFALFSSPNTSVIMGSVPPRQLGVASGVSASMRTLGMMVSMTLVTVLLSLFMGGKPVTAETQGAFLVSMRASLACFSLLCLAGIGCSLGRLGGGAKVRSGPRPTPPDARGNRCTGRPTPPPSG